MKIVLKRIGQILGAIFFIAIFLVQCAQEDIFVKNPVSGKYESLSAVWLSDAIRWASDIIPASSPVLPTVVPTATPATAEGRIDGYFRELTINLAKLERDALRIDSDRGDNGTVALDGVSIYLTYWILENMKTPPKSDTEQVGITEDYTEAHKWLLSVLSPCGELGARAQFGEPGQAMVNGILQLHDECKERIQFLKEKYPDFFICPPGEPCR